MKWKGKLNSHNLPQSIHAYIHEGRKSDVPNETVYKDKSLFYMTTTQTVNPQRRTFI